MNITLAEFTRTIDLAGVFVNALLGGAVAREFRMDPVGFVALAIPVRTGRRPDPRYLAAARPAGGVDRHALRDHRRCGRGGGFPDPDARADVVSAVLLGTISAVGGGALRDLAVNRTPAIFGGNTLYATCAVAASGTVVVFSRFGLASQGALLGVVVGACLCLLARWRGWQLSPSLKWDYRVRKMQRRKRP